MAQGGTGWCTLESDPGVFTELLQQIGVRGVQVEELYALDPSQFAALEPVYGVIFLFKWRPDEAQRAAARDGAGVGIDAEQVFFANQVINNACATQAILSIVLNLDETNLPVKLGDELRNFRDFTKDFDSQLKGLAISNSEVIRAAHNSFAPPNQFVTEESKRDADEDDVYHFISFMPIQQRLYELDGLKSGPVQLGECSYDDWIDKLTPILQRRIHEYSSNEIHFNLMALVRNRKEMYQEERKSLLDKAAAMKAAAAGGNTTDSAEMDDLNARMAELDDLIGEEDAKRTGWKKENVRRKFNYTPFIVEMLKLLASKGELNKMIERASTGSATNPSAPSSSTTTK